MPICNVALWDKETEDKLDGDLQIAFSAINVYKEAITAFTTREYPRLKILNIQKPILMDYDMDRSIIDENGYRLP